MKSLSCLFFATLVALASASAVLSKGDDASEGEPDSTGTFIQTESGVAASYTHNSDTHGCCLQSSGGTFHNRCQDNAAFPSTDAVCQQACDNLGAGCLGWVLAHSDVKCQLAIASGTSCPAGWGHYNSGSLGALSTSGHTCGSGYQGCHIKGAASPVNCVGSWGGWGSCSLTCGTGTQSRTYTITTNSANGGTGCPSANGATENQNCNPQGCPVNCVGSWGGWGSCSLTCGTGTQSRTYTITTNSAHGGTGCPSANGATENQNCNTQACVDCVGAWSNWGSCSVTCGAGTRTRTYSVTIPAAGGVACPYADAATDSKACNTGACDNTLFESTGINPTFECIWSGWYTAGTTVTSGDGKRPGYDTSTITGLRFEDDLGTYAEYTLNAPYSGMTLLQIVQSCTNGHTPLSNDGGAAWDAGLCSNADNVGTLSSSNGSPVGTGSFATTLRIAVGDGSADGDDCAMFMPQTGNGAGDYTGANWWVMGAEREANNAVATHAGNVRIIGLGGSGGVAGDPHFDGFDGSKFDFQGVPGEWWSIISDSDFQLNALFVESPADGKTYMGKLGLMIGNNKVSIGTDKVTVETPTLEMELMKGTQRLMGASGESAGFVHVSDDSVAIHGLGFQITVLTVQEMGFTYLNVESSASSQHLSNPHGLLGQTAQFLVTGEEPKPSYLSHHNKYAAGFVEGHSADYMVSDGQFGTSFTFNRFGSSLNKHGQAHRFAHGKAVYIME